MTKHHNSPEVLVVEDNPRCRLLLKTLLHRDGFAVTVAADGEAALAALAAGPFDLVLLDVRLPKLDGFEVARRARAARHTMPIIAITACALPRDREACLAAGMNWYVSKPFGVEELWAAIAAVVEDL